MGESIFDDSELPSLSDAKAAPREDFEEDAIPASEGSQLPFTEHPPEVVMKGSGVIVNFAPEKKDPAPAKDSMEQRLAQLEQRLAESEQSRAELEEKVSASWATVGDGQLTRKDEINLLAEQESKRLGRGLHPDEMEELVIKVNGYREARVSNGSNKFFPNKPSKGMGAPDMVNRTVQPHNKPARKQQKKGWAS